MSPTSDFLKVKLTDVEPDLALQGADENTCVKFDMAAVARKVPEAARDWARERFEKWARNKKRQRSNSGASSVKGRTATRARRAAGKERPRSDLA